MLPYQIYQELTDQRTREVVAAAERHRLWAEARSNSTEATGSSWRLKDVTAWMAPLLHVRGQAKPRSTVAPTSGAGPVGCSA